MHSFMAKEQEQVMADGLIHNDDGTMLDPKTHLVVDGANVMAQRK